MAQRINEVQRDAILRLLAQGLDRQSIAFQVGVTPGQVSAVAAHVKMGTYRSNPADRRAAPDARNIIGRTNAPVDAAEDRTMRLLDRIPAAQPRPSTKGHLDPVFLGADAETGADVYWNPDPDRGTANPHVLVLGESGFGKTYTISTMLAELARQRVSSIVFDYGQGFSHDVAPQEFLSFAEPQEIHASQDGIAINPLQIFPSDIHGPLNVAQRVADTFLRVYPKLGVQQHAVVRQAVIDALAEEGIVSGARESWTRGCPAFSNVQRRLAKIAEGPQTAQSRVAAAAASHISTLFVFDTFRDSGRPLAWGDMLRTGGVYVIQLKGLEYSLERAVTEFLLWNLIGYNETLGPSALRCFIVLDEAHRLSFEVGSPTEKLLREGRKFGLGLILASQQPEDFSAVAFGNTATKLIFQVGDENRVISRQIHRKLRNVHSYLQVAELITKLPRGWAYAVLGNVGRVVKISSFQARLERWSGQKQDLGWRVGDNGRQV
jgi:DNA phosphorothioation-dependent restriction protein DptH